MYFLSAATFRAGGGLLILLTAALLTGCYDYEEINSFLLEPRRPVAGLEYRVLPPDVIQLTSENIPEIRDVTQMIRPDGKINIPLLGEFNVAEKTAVEIEEMVCERAEQYYGEVDATVQVQGFNSRHYYVFGQVSSPGARRWNGHNTLLEALARAQPTWLAWFKRVRVVRPVNPQEGGYKRDYTLKYKKKGITPESSTQKYTKMTVNLMAMIQQGDMSNNILLKPNDVIYVQPHPLAKVGLALQSILFPVRPAAETVTAPANAANVLNTAGGTGY